MDWRIGSHGIEGFFGEELSISPAVQGMGAQSGELGVPGAPESEEL